LGTLTNRVADSSSGNPIADKVENMSYLPQTEAAGKAATSTLTTINKKPLYYKTLGQNSGAPIVFLHGLGGSNESFMPLVHTLGLQQSHLLHLFDFEGHGLSPTSPLSKLSIESLAKDVNGVFEHANITSGATMIAHSMGSLIAVQFVLNHPGKVSKLILFGPPLSPLPEANAQELHKQADDTRIHGMLAVADDIAMGGVSQKTKTSNQLAITAVKLSLLGQDPEGYAKACTALARAKQLDFGAIELKTLIVTGSEDEISPPWLCEKYVNAMNGRATLRILEDIGHWHVFEDSTGAAKAVNEFLGQK
jgi:pimeloyl-ACP methyl ester carboxylesterase